MLLRFATIALVSNVLAGVYPCLARAEDDPEKTRAESDAPGASFARQWEEVRKKISELSARIKELKQNGKLEEAEALQRQLAGLFQSELQPRIQASTEEAQRRTIAEREFNNAKTNAEISQRRAQAEVVKTLQTESRKLRQELEQLIKAGRPEEAERVQKMLRAIDEKTKEIHTDHDAREGDHRAEGEDAARRAEHLRQAAEHLAAAGFPDQAEQLLRQAVSLVARPADENHSTQNAELRELFTLIRRQNERIERLEQIVQKLVSGGEREEKREKDE